MDPRRNSLTEDVIWKALLRFALPILLGNVFQQLYNTADSLIVGRFLGDHALAAVSSSGSLIFMFMGFFQGLAMGAGVIIAKFYGARDYTNLHRAIHTDVAFGLTVGCLVTVLGVAFSPTILGWMGTPADVLAESIRYFRFFFLGALFTVMYNISVGILQAQGDSRHPLYYLICSSIVNVILDLIFVGVMHLGVGAAALATTISQGLSAVLCLRLMLRTQGPGQLKIREIRFHWNTLRSIVGFGLPSAVQNSVIALANVVVQSNINAFGAAAMAGCGAYSKLEGFAFLPVNCFTAALSTFVGQNLGAHKQERVKKGCVFGIVCSVSMAELVGVLMYIFAPQLIGLFSSSPESLSYGVQHSRTISLFFCLLAFSHCIAAVLRGAGKAVVPMMTMLSSWCVLRVTYITIAVQFVPKLTTVSWAYPLTWTCSSIFLLFYFLKADWIHNFDRLDAKKAQQA